MQSPPSEAGFFRPLIRAVRSLEGDDTLTCIHFVVAKTVKDESIEQVERPDAPHQRKVLDYARHIIEPTGTFRKIPGVICCSAPASQSGINAA